MKIETINPGEDKLVQCRKCEQCIQARKRHWIGRMLAEEQTSHTVWFMTLTYGGGYDNEQAYWLNYNHVQLTFKKLRKAGHRFKYVAVGEHGEQLERAHFHVMMFWQNEPPTAEMNTEFQWEFWDHGHSYLEIPRSNQGCAVYLMDYMNKTNLQKSVMKYSKNPMLGTEYLLEHARKHVREGLSLFAKSDRFTIPNNISQSGAPFYYPVGRETALYIKMLDAYLLEWAIKRPDQPLPLSNDLQEYLSEIVQDTSQCPPPVQRFIAKHYGYEPVTDLSYDKESTYALPNLNLIVNAQFVRCEVYNNEGNIIWQRGLGQNEIGSTDLTASQLGNLVQQVKELAPPRTVPFLKHHEGSTRYPKSEV